MDRPEPAGGHDGQLPEPDDGGRHRATPEPIARPPAPVVEPGDRWSDDTPLYLPAVVTGAPPPRRRLPLVITAVAVLAVLVGLGLWLLPQPSGAPTGVGLTTDEPALTWSTETVPSQGAMPVGTAVLRATPSAQPTTSAAAVESPSAAASGSPSPAPEWTTLTVQATKVWNLGESSQTNRIRLLMQADGDLVILDQTNTVRWRAGTAGRGHHAVFQDDGHFVVYDASQRPWWVSGTAGHPGAVLVFAANGNVTIVDQGTTIWSSNTAS